jgi:hypothetical protein
MHLPGDLPRFQAADMGAPVLMGRKTWQSIGRPLPAGATSSSSRDPGWACGRRGDGRVAGERPRPRRRGAPGLRDRRCADLRPGPASGDDARTHGGGGRPRGGTPFFPLGTVALRRVARGAVRNDRRAPLQARHLPAQGAGCCRRAGTLPRPGPRAGHTRARDARLSLVVEPALDLARDRVAADAVSAPPRSPAAVVSSA